MISLTEYNSFNELESLREEWDRCVLECNSSVYMTFDWCKTWWDFYGRKKELSIQLFFRGNKLIGVLPLYIDKIYFGNMSLKVCRLIGANIPPKVFDPPIQNEYKSLIINKTLQNILPERADVVSFGPVSEFYYQNNILSDINIKHSNSQIVQSNYEPYSYFELPQYFEEYLESINHAEKKDYKYNFKRLNRDYKISIDISKKFDEADFSKFLEMHYLQWAKQGKLGHFNSWPDGKVFNIALAKKQSKLGRFMLMRIVKDDEVIFYDYGYRLGDRFYGQLSARSVLPETQKYSLGTVGMVTLAKTLIDEKINFIEAGLGYYDYKLKLGAKLEKTFIYRFIADKKISLIKYHLLEMEKKIGGLMLHKIWYRRIQPNLPAPLKTPISGRSIKLDY
jgi:CelD/BcsL family acetyltransferase involved in cellulose biosynthesis